MKKIALLMIACLATVSLIACGNTTDTTTASASPAASDAATEAAATEEAATEAPTEAAATEAVATDAVATDAAADASVTDVTDATTDEIAVAVTVPADFPAELSILNATPIEAQEVPSGHIVVYTITGATQDDVKKEYKSALEDLGAKDIKETNEKTADGLDQLILTGKTDTSVISVGLIADTNTPDTVIAVVSVVSADAAEATATAAQ